LTEEWDDGLDGVDSPTTYTYQDGKTTVTIYDENGNLIERTQTSIYEEYCPYY